MEKASLYVGKSKVTPRACYQSHASPFQPSKFQQAREKKKDERTDGLYVCCWLARSFSPEKKKRLGKNILN